MDTRAVGVWLVVSPGIPTTLELTTSGMETHMKLSPDTRRHEVASLLARVVYRLLTRQKCSHSTQDCLDVPAKTLLTVSTTVNTNREQGDA